MAHLPGLRSPYVKVGRIVFFGRMLDKVRLHAQGRLTPDYEENLGGGFDARTCQFLNVNYDELRETTLAMPTPDDEAVLAWCEARGARRPDFECELWNTFMMKRGWHDATSDLLQARVARGGFTEQGIETFFDLIEIDEGRDPFRRQAWLLRPARAAVIMGVAGSGKTTVGRAVADALGWRFADADDFHPPANVAKMSAGIPLDDTDRAPWLTALHGFLAAKRHEGESVVLACSALKTSYREALTAGLAGVTVVYLHAAPEILQARLEERPGHFMKPAMLASQLATLEPPPVEASLHVDVGEPVAEVVAKICPALQPTG